MNEWEQSFAQAEYQNKIMKLVKEAVSEQNKAEKKKKKKKKKKRTAVKKARKYNRSR